jgi:hypothetical protein
MPARGTSALRAPAPAGNVSFTRGMSIESN